MRAPVATYRLQLHADFTLHDAAAIVDYLHALGISDVYLSPIFEATPGSTHGYDVTDPTRVGDALGGRAALEELHERLRAHDLGLLLDIVPNHMAASPHSPWWYDVMRHGRDSPWADFFDIDWGTPERPRPLLLPLLGGSLDEVLGRDELKLVRDADGACHVEYFETRLPVALERCPATAIEQYETASPERRRELLREILAAQHYRLEHWRIAGRRLGYRRFFDITGLVGVRVERPEVFAATHALVRELLQAGIVSGLRVDHVDGLRDPAGYLERLHELARGYVVVEKILERDEPLPRWPVAGTTGYEMLNLINGVFLDEAGYEHVVHAYHRLTGEALRFEDLVYQKKKLVLQTLFGGEAAALTQRLRPLLGEDLPGDVITRMLTELTAAMPVYRTYIRDFQVADSDRAIIERALVGMQQRDPSLDGALVQRLRRVLLLELDESREAALEFVQRWQQFSGPVMAKGFEDTALYAYTPFISANEVGGAPDRATLSVAEFHERMRRRAADWPLALSATATHDTKRGEDTRARLNVLSELAGEWPRTLRQWARRSEAHKEEAVAVAGVDAEDEAPLPNAKEESLLYQTLLGAWPMEGDPDETFVARINEYMNKAVREAKESSSWGDPDPEFEAVLAAFIEQLLAEPWDPGLRAEIAAYADRLAWHGALNSLAQTLLKITSPGVPDFYQGTELWSLALVDPDNRRPVDYDVRRARLRALEPLLAAPRGEDVRALLREWRTGEIKLYLTTAALRFRRAHAELFAAGDYLPLAVSGALAGHVLAFARVRGDDVAITIVPRLLTQLCPHEQLPTAETWADTVVHGLPGEWRNVITGELQRGAELRVGELLRSAPVALLEKV